MVTLLHKERRNAPSVDFLVRLRGLSYPSGLADQFSGGHHRYAGVVAGWGLVDSKDFLARERVAMLTGQFVQDPVEVVATMQQNRGHGGLRSQLVLLTGGCWSYLRGVLLIRGIIVPGS